MTKLYNANCINTDVLEKRQITLSDFYFFQEKEWLILDYLQNISSSLFSKNFFMKIYVYIENSGKLKHQETHCVAQWSERVFHPWHVFKSAVSLCSFTFKYPLCVPHTDGVFRIMRAVNME